MRGRIVFLVLLVAQLACSAAIAIKQKDIPSGSISPPLAVVGDVGVRAVGGGGGVRESSTGGYTWFVDGAVVQLAIVKSLRSELERRGASISPDAARQIELQVDRADLRQTATTHCVIDYRLRLGHGAFRGFQARARALKADNACSEAVSLVVIDVLNDGELRAYLEENA